MRKYCTVIVSPGAMPPPIIWEMRFRLGSRPEMAVTMPTGIIKMRVTMGAIMTTAGDTSVYTPRQTKPRIMEMITTHMNHHSGTSGYACMRR
jgi:hypothetical protein